SSQAFDVPAHATLPGYFFFRTPPPDADFQPRHHAGSELRSTSDSGGAPFWLLLVIELEPSWFLSGSTPTRTRRGENHASSRVRPSS
ncbi:MAG: hypothetical protein WBP81_25105, partial [Solirubrobacteraceae bacterium]